MQRRIEALEGKAKPGGPKGMPGIKPKSGRRPTQNKGPRKPRPHGFARQRMTPTHRVAHAMESCPDCGTRLSGGWTHRTREVIDLPVVPVQVTEHVFIARTCPVCEQRRVPKVDRILERIRGSPVVHADETGWREDGANGYVWTFSTPAQRYFLRRGRHKEVVDEVLDESFSGVLVSDFYAAYHHYPGLKQRCWVHLLRDIHDLKSLYPKDRQLARWAAAVHHIYSVAKSFAHPQARQRQQVQQQLERKLLAQCRPYAQDPAAAQGNLCRRIERHIKELFVFVAAPGMPSDNNAAERSLRPLVISRKISGGTRSKQGTDTKMTLASLFGTWRAQGLDPLIACRQLLSSPQL